MMALLDAIYAATVNQHLKEHDMHKPSRPEAFMPGDYLRNKPKKLKTPDITAQLDALAKGICK